MKIWRTGTQQSHAQAGRDNAHEYEAEEISGNKESKSQFSSSYETCILKLVFTDFHLLAICYNVEKQQTLCTIMYIRHRRHEHPL